MSGGTLLVDGTVVSGSAVTVANGATLGGGGTIAGPVDLSGTLSPNAVGSFPSIASPSYGALTTGALTMESASDLREEIGGTAGYDRLAVTGSAALGGTLDLSSISGSTFGASYTILSATGGITGAFSNAAASGDTLTAGGRTFAIDYAQNAITLTDVTAPDAVSFFPQATYLNGVFTLTGTASSAVGVGSVEITAEVDGVSTDLGSATVDANGTFSFSDRIGAHTQSFITASATDGAGGTASAQATYALTGGKRGTYKAEQDRYNADGSSITAVDRFKADGSQRAALMAGGQIFASASFDTFDNDGAPSSTFVFDPGFGKDVVNLLRVDGTDHDFLSFKGSDFGNSIATVLNSARDTKAGLLITDPTASSPGPGGHDKVLLKGITKGQLSANRGDITFHA